jgi:hypothetical protein
MNHYRQMANRTPALIASCISSVADGFERFSGKPGSWYRRFRAPLFSFVVVQHSTKYKCFGVDVVSTVFSSCDRQLGTHQLRRSAGLANLRVGSSMIETDQIPYRYVADPEEASQKIAEELRRFAVPWFDEHQREIAADPLVRRGMAELEGRDPATSIETMKWALRDEAAQVGASKWYRKETAILAADLLKWAVEERSEWP